jgi:chromosome segregation protein
VRLSQIKLAGFKSFVDPTQIPIPGELVGVVGPNGCGKSNVIDAIRWVLGESRAAALRGETMQDVIFNGAADRKPVARASVELIFDNASGRAGGPWAPYSEISIKRVLVRNGESSYYINNQHVRRRDVADIFLGTGLGPRAYAIIEQGMISRVVEAKPDELRVFLEEAAGVSKYRERRRETEFRLGDTRHNLARVNDVLRELQERLTKLQAQAEVARQYSALRMQAETTQNLIWLIKKKDAAAARLRLRREHTKIELELEAAAARLTEAETELTRLRESHYSATNELDSSQAAFYSANAGVAAIEQRLQYLRESRRRLEDEIAAQRTAIARERSQRLSAEVELEKAREQLVQATQALDTAGSHIVNQEQALESAQMAWREAQARFDSVQSRAQNLQQQLQVEDTRREHSLKILEQYAVRRERLKEEQSGEIEQGAEDQMSTDLTDTRAQLSRINQALTELEREAPERLLQLSAADETVKTIQDEITGLQARLDAIQQIQHKLDGDEKMGEWIAHRQLFGLPRLWQCIDIRQGWEMALEAVLRERLNGIAAAGDVAGACLAEPPPAKVTLMNRGSDFSAEARDTVDGWQPLRALITLRETRLSAALSEWLHGVYAVEDANAALAAQPNLSPGVMLVSREGHVFTRHSVSFYAPDSLLHGVLERQREIEQLRGELKKRIDMLYHEREQFQTLEQKAGAQRREIVQLRAVEAEAKERLHALEVEALKHKQQIERERERRTQIARELAEIAGEEIAESGRRDIAENRLVSLRVELASVEEELNLARSECEIREHAYQGEREFAESARADQQQALFGRTLVENTIAGIEKTIGALDESRLAAHLEKLLEQARILDETTLVAELSAALAKREEKERALAQTRKALEERTALLREKEHERLEFEQRSHPMRESLTAVRLKEQEARVNEEQYAEQLKTANADDEALSSLLDKNMRAAPLQNELARLKEEIETLGPVNLAALDELNTEVERKSYLDSQAADLNEAVTTLENAIRRIDRETRERLQQTFDQVNRHFGETFPTLFGGGQAKMILSGEEILDAGVQILAQPPGKKNTSIHLLSGGEKALCALALVFSLFKLNPAPFCVLDEVDAPLDDSNTERFCELIKSMAGEVQFLFITHNKISMEIARHLIGVTMPELGVSRVVAVDIEQALRLREEVAA